MKRTLTINLNGIVFHIDEDAYEKLRHYLAAIENSFKNSNDAKEVIADIEARVSELFQEKLENNKQVITIEDVESIIVILGRPEDFESDNIEYENSSEKTHSSDYKTGKRMFRDLDDAILGGVASGLAAYFGIDPVIMRVLFVISFFFSGPLIYIILWIVIPAAHTPSQKLEMRGEKVNIENIEKQVKGEFENVKKNFRKFDEKHDLRNRLETLLTGVVDVFTTLLKPLSIFFLVIVVLLVVFAFVGLFSALSGEMWTSELFFSNFWDGINGLPLPAFLNLVIAQEYVNVVITGILIIIIVPILSILYAISRGIMGWGRSRSMSGIFSFMFLFGLVMLIFVAISEASNFKAKEKSINESFINADSIKNLKIVLTENPLQDCLDEEENYDVDCGYYKDWQNYAVINEDFKIESRQGNISLFISPDIYIKKSSRDSISIKTRKESFGTDSENAKISADNISYEWKLQNDTLFISPYFSLSSSKKWRKQELDVVISIPEGIAYTVADDIRYNTK